METEDISQVEVTKDDNKTSFLEAAIGIIKKGAGVVGGLWVATVAAKVVLDIANVGATNAVDTTFLEQTSNTLLPVFTGLVMTLVGWFIRDQAQ